jgi:hypothetical protein
MQLTFSFCTIIQLYKKASTWTVIKSFSNIEFEELNGNNTKSPTNVIALDANVHNLFGPLDVWFEAVSVRCAFICDMCHQ